MGVMDANTAGNVHGGVILRLCDEAAGLAAVRHSRGRVVTAGMDRMTFACPVYIGQLVTCRATVNAAWRTSIEVGVRVESEDVRTGEVRHACTAYLTMVALDRDGQPTPVPSLEPSTEDERRRPRPRGTPRRGTSAAASTRRRCGATPAWPSANRSGRAAAPAGRRAGLS